MKKRIDDAEYVDGRRKRFRDGHEEKTNVVIMKGKRKMIEERKRWFDDAEEEDEVKKRSKR